MIKKITKREWLFLILLTLVVVLVTTVPFIRGYLNTPESKYYLGLHSLSSADYSVYYSWMMPAYQGHFFIRDLYTQEASAYNIINTFWSLAGGLGKIFQLSPRGAFQLARILAIPILLISLYLLVSHYFQSLKKRRLALIFLAFATGISGFFISLLDKFAYVIDGYYHWPMDLWVSESNVFLTMFHSGHMAMSLALMVLIFYFLLLFIEHYNFKYSIWAGILNLVLLSFYPFTLPIIFGVLGGFWLAVSLRDKKIAWKLLAHLLIIVFISLPMLIYYLIMLNFDFVTIQRALQNVCLTPAWYFLFFSFGFLLIFGFWGLYLFFKNRQYWDNKKIFIVIWFLVQLSLIFFPFNFQRRLVEGLQIPLVFLTTESIFYFYDYFKRRLSDGIFKIFINNQFIWLFLFIIGLALTNIHLWRVNLYLIKIKSPAIYYPNLEIEAMEWLKNNVNEEDLILAKPMPTMHLIPGIAGRRVFAGHEVETINYQSKVLRAEWFFKTNIFDQQKIDFLTKNKISRIFYGEFERRLGDFKPEEKSYLREVYSQGGVKVYEVLIP